MNATFGEVIREVLTGLLITKPAEGGVGSKDDALERKGFRDRADLRLGAMHRLFEREKQIEKYQS